jgi:hypothetical protein
VRIEDDGWSLTIGVKTKKEKKKSFKDKLEPADDDGKLTRPTSKTPTAPKIASLISDHPQKSR